VVLTRLVVETVHEDSGMTVRAAFVRYRAGAGRSRSGGSFQLAAVSGQPPLRWSTADAGDLAVAAREAMAAGETVRGEGRQAHALGLPGGADHFARVPVVAEPLHFGLLCVDTWGSLALTTADLHPVQGLANLLAAGLAVGDIGQR
jgi:hypothetical protein